MNTQAQAMTLLPENELEQKHRAEVSRNVSVRDFGGSLFSEYGLAGCKVDR